MNSTIWEILLCLLADLSDKERGCSASTAALRHKTGQGYLRTEKHTKSFKNKA